MVAVFASDFPKWSLRLPDIKKPNVILQALGLGGTSTAVVT
jgi:hypothetical protein